MTSTDNNGSSSAGQVVIGIVAVVALLVLGSVFEWTPAQVVYYFGLYIMWVLPVMLVIGAAVFFGAVIWQGLRPKH